MLGYIKGDPREYLYKYLNTERTKTIITMLLGKKKKVFV